MPKYFIRTADGTRGPFPGKEVQALIEAGRLQPNDLIRQDGDPNWHPVSAVRGLRGSATAVPSMHQPDGGSVAAISHQVSNSVGDLGAEPAAPIAEPARSTTRSSSRIWVVAATTVVLLAVAGAGWVLYRGSEVGLQQESDSFVQAILDGEPVGAARTIPYSSRLESLLRGAEQARLSRDANALVTAMRTDVETRELSRVAVLARYRAGNVSVEQLAHFTKVLESIPGRKFAPLSTEEWQWLEHHFGDQEKLISAFTPTGTSLSAGKEIREILRDAEKAALAKRSQERREQQAKAYTTSGEFRVAEKQAGKVAFGREFLVPPRVEVSTLRVYPPEAHEISYASSIIITEVTATGFSWQCTLEWGEENGRASYRPDTCRLRWEATGPIRVSDLP